MADYYCRCAQLRCHGRRNVASVGTIVRLTSCKPTSNDPSALSINQETNTDGEQHIDVGLHRELSNHLICQRETAVHFPPVMTKRFVIRFLAMFAQFGRGMVYAE